MGFQIHFSPLSDCCYCIFQSQLHLAHMELVELLLLSLLPETNPLFFVQQTNVT